MADYRYIHTKIWRDEWFSELSTDGKVLWLYLLTNQSASLCGMFKLPDKFTAFETGLCLERVKELKEQFRQAGKIDYEGEIIWIIKMRDFQSSHSPKIIACIQKDVEAIPDGRIKDIYCERYDIDIPSIPHRNQTKPNSKPIPYQTKPLEGASAPAQAGNLEPIAIIKRITGKRSVPIALYESLCDTLTSKPDEVKLKACWVEWIARGYKESNYAWALDWYKNGIPSKNGANNHGNGNNQNNLAGRASAAGGEYKVADRSVIDGPDLRKVKPAAK